MTFSSPPGEGLGAIKSTWHWSTDVTDRKPLVTVPLTRALRELLRKGATSQRAKQSHERPEDLTLRTVHCVSLSPIWDKRLMLELKHQYFCHLMGRTDSFEKTLMLWKTEGRRRSGWQRIRWLDGIPSSMDMSLSNLQELVMDREACHDVVHGVTGSDMTERVNFTERMLYL